MSIHAKKVPVEKASCTADLDSSSVIPSPLQGLISQSSTCTDCSSSFSSSASADTAGEMTDAEASPQLPVSSPSAGMEDDDYLRLYSKRGMVGRFTGAAGLFSLLTWYCCCSEASHTRWARFFPPSEEQFAAQKGDVAFIYAASFAAVTLLYILFLFFMMWVIEHAFDERTGKTWVARIPR